MKHEITLDGKIQLLSEPVRHPYENYPTELDPSDIYELTPKQLKDKINKIDMRRWWLEGGNDV